MESNILVVEDNPLKAEKLQQLVAEVLPSATVIWKASFVDGLRAAVAGEFSIIILDMSLPAFFPDAPGGGGTRPYAGREFLHQLRLRRVPTPVVVVTQFDVFGQGEAQRSLAELRQELRAEFGQSYLETIFYSPAETAWRQQLSRVLLESKDVGRC